MTDTSTVNSVPEIAVTALAKSAWLLRPAAPASLPVEGPQPLAGLRFAVKDNIDVAGWRTTAGCAEFAFEATASAQAHGLAGLAGRTGRAGVTFSINRFDVVRLRAGLARRCAMTWAVC